MAFDIDPTLALAGAPVVTLGGREFFMAPLAMRQLRLVAPLAKTGLKAIAALPETIVFSTGEFDTLLGAVHAALTRAYPALTLDDLLDLPIAVEELAAAFKAALISTGMYHPQEANAGATGDAPGAWAGDAPAGESISTG